MKSIRIHKQSSPQTVFHLKYRDTFFGKLLGLMFAQEIDIDGGIIIAEKTESIARAAIHMLFMNFDITVLWLDQEMVVVDKALAKKWKPFYAPTKSAQYIVEIHSARYDDFSIGDKLIVMR